MTGTAQPFLDAIALTEEGPLRFSAQPQSVPWPKAYGGDSVAQALAAATRTVEAGRLVHSMHSYFLRPVDIGERVLYEVAVVRDGRGFSHRSVVGSQHGREVLHATLSFAAGAAGAASYAAPQDRPVARPEDLPTAEEALRSAGLLDSAAGAYWAGGRSFDLRHDPAPLYGRGMAESAGAAGQAVWVRALSPIPQDPATQRTALAYVCDYTILESLLRVQGLGWGSAGLATASLDHSMWFHRAADLNEWLLYVQEAVSVQEERGLATGRFYTAGGVLVASVAQEGVLRVR
ncbi:acyl-CoA thioesterase domain-containing protein [Rathayibacter sp. VKM Ac-2760]|uniref:acyl-CoA thioesterase n=1 Tax=Rathayibacter sp. VKM Ac-2760 TaxID=2609253 RepID=UPI001318E5B0|nr:acyl-CoA thioesterase domain-containing protein [Rathayibacter sp. VKM Ac-2760]QHC60173.1 acyl-CoA thioesterase II [Rathayibacter sp. VKM Ac-2760]